MTSSEKISEGMNLIGEGLGEILSGIAKALNNAVNSILPLINKTINKKLTKKKFKKMLQASGIQRNEINKIVANNKDPYTYRRLSETLNLYKKEEE